MLELRDGVWTTLIAGDLLGRWHALRDHPEAQRVAGVEFADPASPETWDNTRLTAFARDFLFSKRVLTTADFNALSDYYRQAAFKIAGVSRLDALRAVRDALAAAVSRGESAAQAALRVQSALIASGYSPLDPWHADLVAQQALAQSYGAASYQSLTNERLAGLIPFFRYVCVVDEFTRPNHLVWNNHFFKSGNPIWQKIWPPNGFRCRCSVKGVSVNTVTTYGIAEDSIPRGGNPDPGFSKAPGVWLDQQAGIGPARRARRFGGGL